MYRAALLFAFVIGISCGPARGQPKGHPSDQQRPADSKAPQSQSKQRGTEESPIFIHILQDPQGKADTAKTQSEDGNKPLYDALTAWGAIVAAGFTGLLVIVGVFGVRAANRTLEAIRQQGNLMAREFELSHRPWVAVELAVTDTLEFDSNGLKVPVRFTLKNTGNSPALRTFIDAVIDTNWDEGIVDANWRLFCSKPNSGLGKRIGVSLFPGSTTVRDESFIVTRKMIEENLDPTESRFLKLTIMGKVGYEFSFAERECQSPFIYELRQIEPSSTGVSLPRERPIENLVGGYYTVDLRPYYPVSPDIPPNQAT